VKLSIKRTATYFTMCHLYIMHLVEFRFFIHVTPPQMRPGNLAKANGRKLYSQTEGTEISRNKKDNQYLIGDSGKLNFLNSQIEIHTTLHHKTTKSRPIFQLPLKPSPHKQLTPECMISTASTSRRFKFTYVLKNP
jgi:hypothetical protein